MADDERAYKLLPLVKMFFQRTNLSSKEFVDIFKRFDVDNKGCITKVDIDEFLQQIIYHLKDEYTSMYTIDTVKKSFIPTSTFSRGSTNGSTNGSAQLSMQELTTALLTGENETKLHIADFMKIWYHYDADKNGYLEPDELKKLLHDLHAADNTITNQELDVEEADLIDEYLNVILNLYDTNDDGKIELSELSKILPVEENFLAKFKTQEMTKDDFEALFNHYDHDGNGFIEDTELVGFIRDLLQNKNREPTTVDLEQYRTSIMGICDTNNDGKLSKQELELLLLGKNN